MIEATLNSLPPIVIVEDDQLLGISLKRYMETTLKTKVMLFQSSEDCLLDFAKTQNVNKPFVLVADISLGQGSDGLLLIDLLKERGLSFVSIIMTGFASIETAIMATKKGALHYLTKPFEPDHLARLVLQAIRTQLKISLSEEIISENSNGLTKISSNKIGVKIEKPTVEDINDGVIGRCFAMKQVFEIVKRCSKTDSPILLTGEAGTGKQLIANIIHKNSPRSKAQMISVNCAAIPKDLIESELFGHVKGSFNGAISDRKGRLEMASGGTLFIDEIADLPHTIQVKLSRFLQDKKVEPVGSNEPKEIDLRLIVASHKDLEKEVAEGRFREDLLYQLNVIPIKIPSLKERREDIPLLISFFLDRFISADKSNEIFFSTNTIDLLIAYDWPGNVRELENLLERLVILRGGQEILPEDLPAKIFTKNPLMDHQYKSIFKLPEVGIDIKQILSDIEDSLIVQAISRTGGNKNQASKLLGLNRTTLIEKMKKKHLEL